MTRKRSTIVGLFILAVVLAVLVACAPAAPPPPTTPTPAGPKTGEPIKIGLLAPTKMGLGIAELQGAQMAVDEINAAGGVVVGGTKHQLVLVAEDTNEFVSLPDGVAAAEKLISREKPFMVTGIIRSELAPTVMDLCAANKILFFSVGTGSMALPKMVKDDYAKYKYWFRIMPINSVFLGQNLPPFVNYGGQVVREAYGLPAGTKLKVGVMVEKGEAGDIVTKSLSDALAGFNMESVGAWRPASTQTDLTGELSAIQAAGAQMIAGWFYTQVGIPFAKQLGELQIPAPFFGTNASASSKGFWDATVGKGNYMTACQQTYARTAVTPKTIPFWDKYNTTYKDFPMATAMTYDGVYILKDAAEKAGALNPDSIVSIMEKTEFVTTAGKAKWYGLNDPYPHDSYYAMGYGSSMLGIQWVNNEFRCVWPWQYEGVTYEGTKKAEVAPWAVEYWKKQLAK